MIAAVTVLCVFVALAIVAATLIGMAVVGNLRQITLQITRLANLQQQGNVIAHSNMEISRTMSDRIHPTPSVASVMLPSQQGRKPS